MPASSTRQRLHPIPYPFSTSLHIASLVTTPRRPRARSLATATTPQINQPVTIETILDLSLHSGLRAIALLPILLYPSEATLPFNDMP